MNRRSFFNKFGAAILGTAIALKLPDNIIPRVPDLNISTSSFYAFGWTGFENENVKGRILAQVNLQVLIPRMPNTIYIKDC